MIIISTGIVYMLRGRSVDILMKKHRQIGAINALTQLSGHAMELPVKVTSSSHIRDY